MSESIDLISMSIFPHSIKYYDKQNDDGDEKKIELKYRPIQVMIIFINIYSIPVYTDRTTAFLR
jgi:hypothetical protein